MTRPSSPYTLPSNLPVPVDDGAASHLLGAALPDIQLPATNGTSVSLRAVSSRPSIFFFYPRTGVPDEPLNLGFRGEDWDEIPGARGCTPQNCAFRDLHQDFIQAGFTVWGVSTQTSAFQAEFKARNHVPFEYLSDFALELVTVMRLPTFEFPVESGGPNTLIRRMSWLVLGGTIRRVWYPVFPPQDNAQRVWDAIKAL